MKLLIASLTLAMLVLTGCTQKNPDVDMTGKDAQQTTEVRVDKKVDDISGMDGVDRTSTDVTKDAANRTEHSIKDMIKALESDLNNVYFDFDKYDIKPDMQSKIRANARLLNTINSRDFSVKVEGNTDEWGTDEYNYALGLRRGKAVKDTLVSLGVDEGRIMIVSLGESNPASMQSNKEAWAKNRRVEFKVLP